MKFLSQLITVGSGSVGGLVASHNKGGNYFRAKVIPVNPQTDGQTEVRNALTQLVDAWKNVLLGPKRNGWNLYAENVPVADSLGQSIFLSGQQHFIRSNVPRLQFLGTGIAGAITTAPSLFDTGEIDSSASMTLTAPSALAFTFDNTLAWANEDDSLMIIYSGRPVNLSIFFFKGPYQIAGAVLGDGTIPPVSPAALTTQQAYVAGQRIHTYARISRADGRLSAKFLQFRQTVI